MLASESFPTALSVLRDRITAFVLLGTAALLLTVFAIGLPGWPCPFLYALGVPCPGCGLTRATSLLLQGQVQASLHFHAFAPIVVMGLIIIASAALLPETARNWWIDKLVLIERRTGVVLILLAVLILYWLARLIFMNAAFVQLIRG